METLYYINGELVALATFRLSLSLYLRYCSQRAKAGAAAAAEAKKAGWFFGWFSLS